MIERYRPRLWRVGPTHRSTEHVIGRVGRSDRRAPPERSSSLAGAVSNIVMPRKNRQGGPGQVQRFVRRLSGPVRRALLPN